MQSVIRQDWKMGSWAPAAGPNLASHQRFSGLQAVQQNFRGSRALCRNPPFGPQMRKQISMHVLVLT